MSRAAYACDPAHTRGRRVAEPPAASRSEFQRDRDRIVHCTAFRRLVYKTQVFVNHEGDLFRTRLTHSLEVAQLGRSIARALRLNEDLVEAIALAHDLGHTPFGHAGQDALAQCMHGHGGFEHNLQSLRVVDVLEQRYANFDGLNLCLETRAGILKHCPARVARFIDSLEPNGVAQRFIHQQRPSLEAQLVNLADEMAYNAHDVDDGLRSGLLSWEALCEVPLFTQSLQAVLRRHPRLARAARRRLLSEVLRHGLSAQVADVIDTSTRLLRTHRPDSAQAVASCPPLVMFSPALREAVTTMKRFLFAHLYRHPQVVVTTAQGRQVIATLFQAYTSQPRQLPEEHRQAHDVLGPRALADYIAGMTDRFASREFERLAGRSAFA
jgi:dGTPase